MAIGRYSKSRNLPAHNRLQKRSSVRRVLLETLESRQLMAVGPQLIGIQPNSGDLLQNGEILQQSPTELVFRFNDGIGIDPTTLGGIRVIRSGEDGVFERTSIATDFGTGGQTLVEFYAQTPGQAGNGIELRLSQQCRARTRECRSCVLAVGESTSSSIPILRADTSGRSVASFERDSGTAATNLVFALPLRRFTDDRHWQFHRYDTPLDSQWSQLG